MVCLRNMCVATLNKGENDIYIIIIIIIIRVIIIIIIIIKSRRERGLFTPYLMTLAFFHRSTARSIPIVPYSCAGFTFNK